MINIFSQVVALESSYTVTIWSIDGEHMITIVLQGECCSKGNHIFVGDSLLLYRDIFDTDDKSDPFINLPIVVNLDPELPPTGSGFDKRIRRLDQIAGDNVIKTCVRSRFSSKIGITQGGRFSLVSMDSGEVVSTCVFKHVPKMILLHGGFD